MTDKYAVIGNPVSHSKSPLIHGLFAKQTGQDLNYVAIEAPLDGFAATIDRLRAEGYKGCNVTVPFKFEAFQIATELSDRARSAQAVNTLSFDGDAIRGDNTDGAGLVRDLEHNHGINLYGMHVLLMGAGGAAYGVAFPLAAAGAALTIVNRTEDKGERLAAAVREYTIQAIQKPKGNPTKNKEPGAFNLTTHQLAGVVRAGKVESCSYFSLADKHFDIVINATSASLPKLSGLLDLGSTPDLPQDIFSPHALAYDMMYGGETFFLSFAKQHGATYVSDGMGMLVEQAAEAFFIWRGVRPDTAPVLKQLRETA